MDLKISSKQLHINSVLFEMDKFKLFKIVYICVYFGSGVTFILGVRIGGLRKHRKPLREEGGYREGGWVR